MADKESSSNELAIERTDLAENRTDWAEDRTIMANERTFAGWMRTGLAAAGIGLGFNALFGKLEPLWVPKAIAKLLMIIGFLSFRPHSAMAVRYRTAWNRIRRTRSGQTTCD